MEKQKQLNNLIKKVKLFSSLDEPSLKLLKDHMNFVAFQPGTTICTEGDKGDRMYVVDSGNIRVVKKDKDGNPIEITILKHGEVAGMMSLFESEYRSATLEAIDEVELWEIDNMTFQNLLNNHPVISMQLLAVLSKHLRRETSVVAELRSHDEDNRLKIVFFDSKPYTIKTFNIQNKDRYALRFFDTRLDHDTVSMAKGFKIICVFVNDQLDAPVIEMLNEYGVEMIALRCAGYNNVDLKACKQYGIKVTRVPAYSPYAVAEHAVALMMALNRHIHRAHNRVREGNFSLNNLVGFDMHGKTVGIIGTGRIGRCLINILIGFGCRILVYDKYPNKQLQKETGITYVELDELLANSDIISLHAPLTNETHHMINESSIKKIKKGAMLINTSRGGLINTKALIAALLEGQIGSAGLDVYEEESEYFFEDFSSTFIADEALARLTTFNNVMITSHMAFLTNEALVNIADTTLENIEEFISGAENLTNGVVFKEK